MILDGARADVFAHLVDAGDLPHISRHLLERGGIAPATTVFPSTTGVAYLPFLTGCYPGTCNVPGIRWMDVRGYRGEWWSDREHLRSYCGPQGGLINRDLRPDLETLFDLEPDSVALCSPFTRGLSPERDRVQWARALWGAVAHYVGTYGPLERAVGRALCRTARERSRFVFAVFPGVDGVTHFWDPWHPLVLDMYRAFDRIIGEYAAAGGFDGDHLTLLVSDHGLTRVDHHTDVSLELEAWGIPALRYPGIWRRDPQIAVMVSGNGSVQLYLRPGVPRQHRFTIGEIEAGAVVGVPRTLVRQLAQLPGVALVVGHEGSEVQLVGRQGRARLIDAGEGRIRYEPDTADLLGLGAPAVRHEREWLRCSMSSPYPDAPAQLLQIFRAPRTGDLVVIAEVGWDLRRDWEIPEHRSGHGSLTADHMRCLVACSRALAGPLRTVDTFPLILDHLGIPLPAGIDGVLPAAPAEPARRPAVAVRA